MIIMSLLFILLLAFSVAALAVTTDQQRKLITSAWHAVDSNQHAAVEKRFQCCGLFKSINGTKGCVQKRCKDQTDCPCYDKIREPLDKALSVSGGVGLFFSFTLLLAVYLTVRYRNQKDPRTNADAFL